jgi:uncharacterized protein with HEPN domain
MREASKDKIVWDTIHNNLPVLKEKIKSIYDLMAGELQ